MKKFLNKHSTAVLIFPYAALFVLFIIIPVGMAILLSFTHFNTIQFPTFAGFANYISLFTSDSIFMQKVLPNTIIYALFVGVGGYLLSFILAWMLAQLTRPIRTLLTVIIYSPSMTGGVMLSTIWAVIFTGDKSGYLNALLLNLDIIDSPIAWTQNENYLLLIMIIVTLWSSMGIGFLSMLSGITNGNQELYEAGRIDGITNRFQEIIYITIPQAKPQMLFGAIMAIVNTFQTSGIGTILSGANPTPNYSGQLIVTHIEDYGFQRYEMGYAAAISVVLLIFVFAMSEGSKKLFSTDD